MRCWLACHVSEARLRVCLSSRALARSRTCCADYLSRAERFVSRARDEQPQRRTSRHVVSLQDRNEKARLCIRALRATLNTSREVHSEVSSLRRTIASQTGTGADSVRKTKGEVKCSTNCSSPPQWPPLHTRSFPPTPRKSAQVAAATTSARLKQ